MNKETGAQRWGSSPVLDNMLSREAFLHLSVIPDASYNQGHRRFLLEDSASKELGLGDKVLLKMQSERSKWGLKQRELAGFSLALLTRNVANPLSASRFLGHNDMMR